MPTIAKGSKKESASLGKLIGKKAAKKSSPKNSIPPKNTANTAVKKTVVKAVPSKKSINAPIKKAAKKAALKKAAPAKAVVKKIVGKVDTAKRITTPTTPNKNNSGETKNDMDIALTANPDVKKDISNLTEPPSSIPAEHNTNTSSPISEIYTSPIAQPDFRSGKNDGYQNKIQLGNKSKSGIKPSGKKPLW